MRTIEEIRQDIKKSDDSVGIVRGFEYLNLFMELAQAQDAEIARLRLQCEWQPIETAPKDGTVIELIAPMSEYPRIGKWVDFPSFVFRGVREPGISKWVDANLTFPEIKNPILWRAIPPLPQPQEGSPMDNTLTDEVYP